MQNPNSSPYRNNLLIRMNPEDLSRIAPHLQFLDLPRSLALAEPGKAGTSRIFPRVGSDLSSFHQRPNQKPKSVCLAGRA